MKMKLKNPLPRLKYRNNWEYDQYLVNGKLITSLKEVIINGYIYKVKSRQVSVPYSDMGQQGYSCSTHYFVKEKVFGVTMEFDLNTIVGKKGALVLASEYTLEKI